MSFHLDLREDLKKINIIPELKSDFHDIEKLHLLGRGGCGQVYKAKHKEWGMVAYKELSGNRSSNNPDPLLRELNYLKHLSHPNIIQLLGYVWEEESYGLLLPYLKYGDLDHFLRKVGSVSEFSKIKFGEEIATGMNYLHTRKPKAIVHRDLKIANVLVDDGFHMKITDFGISAWRKTETQVSRVFTSADSNGGGGGTVTHVAPEKWRNINHRPTQPYDVYAMAILMWEIFTEEHPYGDAEVQQIKQAVMDGQRPDMETFMERCSFTQIHSLLEACWHQNPKQRPSFQEIMKGLESLCTVHRDRIEQHQNALQRQLSEPKQSPTRVNADSGIGPSGERSSEVERSGERSSEVERSGERSSERPNHLQMPQFERQHAIPETPPEKVSLKSNPDICGQSSLPSSTSPCMGTPRRREFSDGIRTVLPSVRKSPLEPFQDHSAYPSNNSSVSSQTACKERLAVEAEETPMKEPVVVSVQPVTASVDQPSQDQRPNFPDRQAQSMPAGAAASMVPQYVMTNPELPVPRVATRTRNTQLSDPAVPSSGRYEGVERSTRDTVPEFSPPHGPASHHGASNVFGYCQPSEPGAYPSGKEAPTDNMALKQSASEPAISSALTSGTNSVSQGFRGGNGGNGTAGNGTAGNGTAGYGTSRQTSETSSNSSINSLETDAGPTSLGSHRKAANHRSPTSHQSASSSAPILNINLPAMNIPFYGGHRQQTPITIPNINVTQQGGQSSQRGRVTGSGGGGESIQCRSERTPLQIGDNNHMNINFRGLTQQQRQQLRGNANMRGGPNTGTPTSKPKVYITDSLAILDDENIRVMSTYLGLQWKKVGRALGLTDGELESVEYDHQIHGLQEIIIQMLRLWREKNATAATFKQLADRLIDLKMMKEASKLKAPRRT